MTAAKTSIAFGAAALICLLGTLYLGSAQSALLSVMAFGPVLFGTSVVLAAVGLVVAFVGAKHGGSAGFSLTGGVLSAAVMFSSAYVFWAVYRTIVRF
jgi:hypothetical protein